MTGVVLSSRDAKKGKTPTIKASKKSSSQVAHSLTGEIIDANDYVQTKHLQEKKESWKKESTRMSSSRRSGDFG